MRPGRVALLVAVTAALVIGVVLAARAGDDGSGSSQVATKPAQRDQPVSNRSATVWAVGDGADGSDDGHEVADMISRGKPDRVLYLGDVYENGTQEEFERNYRPVYGEFDSITAPTPGNHDWHNREQGYDPYWESAGLDTSRHFYSFRAGGWEFVSLNSESGLEDGSPQREWLKRYRDRSGDCRIAFWHRPYMNAGQHGDQKQTEPLWRGVQGRAALVVNGHDHNFQHFRPKDGIVQLISGAGGHKLYQSDGKDPRLVWDDDDVFGALRLDLRPGVARFKFVTPPGRTLHSGTVRCQKS